MTTVGRAQRSLCHVTQGSQVWEECTRDLPESRQLSKAPEPLTLPPDPLCSVSLPTHWHSLHDLCAERAGIMHLEMVIYVGREPLLWTWVLLTFPAALWASRPPSLCFLLCLLPPLGLHAASSGHFGVCGQSPQSKSMLNQGCDWQTRKQQWNLIFHGKVSAPCLYAQWRWFLFTSCVVGVFKLHGLFVRLKSCLIFIMAKSNSRETFLGDRKPVHVPSTGQNTIERDKRMLHLESAIYGSDYGKQPAFFRFQMLT